MQFIVHVDEELSHVPQAYHNKKPGMTTVVEPGKVDWQIMVKNLRYHGYKGEADLYYIKPGCVPPEGMVQMSGQHDVDEMLHALEGIKKCHLYIVKNCAFLDNSDDDMSEQDMSEEDIYACGYMDIGERDLGEYGSSPKRKKLADNNPKKALDFGSSDEPLQ
nr:uncharacterized protein LOC120963884 [Aegilops tauschii subsp. strangulata]